MDDHYFLVFQNHTPHDTCMTTKPRKTPIAFTDINGDNIFAISSSNTSYLLLEPAMLRFAGCCFLLLLLVSGLDFALSESQCELVFEYFPYCLEFLTGNYYKPSKRCCGHIYKLNRLANRGLGARLICWCIEYMVRGTEPRIMADRISELPTECQTHLSFPISEWMDCNSIG